MKISKISMIPAIVCMAIVTAPAQAQEEDDSDEISIGCETLGLAITTALIVWAMDSYNHSERWFLPEYR